MSKELVRKRERATIPRWMARIIGVTGVAAALMIPSGIDSSLESEPAQFSTGISLQDKLAAEAVSPLYDEKTGLTRDTGMDTEPCRDFGVCGTDLGQPFLMPNGSVCYLFGDTFAVAGPFLKDLPDGADKYRAQAMLCSDTIPTEGKPIIFDRAPGLEGTGISPETLGQWHILMNDGVTLPNGDIVVSYQHTAEVKDPPDHTWYTDYAGLAVSHDGGNTFQITGPKWQNDTASNLDPYQMWSMQRDGDYVYIVSDRAGRRPGPMMLFRVKWDQMLTDQNAYEYWNGTGWGAKADAKPLMQGHFGEPSLRKLGDGTWAMSYADYMGYPKIVTQYVVDPAQGPEGKWSDPKIQLTAAQLPNLYGGGIVPTSTKDELVLMISTWQTSGTAKDISDRTLVRYDVSHLVGKL